MITKYMAFCLGSIAFLYMPGCNGIDEVDVQMDASINPVEDPDVHPALALKRANPSQYDAQSALNQLEYLSICGEDDFQYVNAYDGTLGKPFIFVYSHKDPVGIMHSSANGGYYCSGTLVGPNLFLTASHCVDNNTTNHYVSFNRELQGGAGSTPLEQARFRISEILDDSTAVDIALLRLEHDPGARFRWARINEFQLSINETITIIQHPQGRHKQVEIGHISQISNDRYYYGDLDTEPGSSGSGILDSQGFLIGVHTNGGCTKTGGSNSGTKTSRAVAVSPEIAKVADGIHWHKNMGWCYHTGGSIYVGDFNGDGRADMMCHDTAGRAWNALTNTSGQFTGTNWGSNYIWCTNGDELHIGDFNGDERDDMLCHSKSDGQKWISYADQSGKFHGTNWHANLNWCNHSGSSLYTGDFNGDNRDDMMCHDTQGRVWIALASSSGTFSGTTHFVDLGWCYHNGSRVHIGDYNGDNRDDMICHDTNGSVWRATADSSGNFFNDIWFRAMDWCKGTNKTVHIGDFNGDGRDDMLCYFHTQELIYTNHATTSGTFTNPTHTSPINICHQQGGEIHIGKFNTDPRSDMLCHDPQGTKAISYANIYGGF